MQNKMLVVLMVLLVFIFSIITILPLFHAGFFPIHDNTQIQRVFEMHKSLQDGMFPVRWVNDLGYGYGYPLFNFYGPLAYYSGGFSNFWTDSLAATKIMIAIAMIGSGLSMFFFAKNLLGKWGGLISAALYLFAPYHAVDLYVRGDIGEIWAYMFIPLVGLGFYKLYQEVERLKVTTKKSSWFAIHSVQYGGILLGAVSFAGVILSHNLSAFMMFPFLIFYCIMLILFSKNKPFAVVAFLYTVALGFGLSAFYFLPVFTEMKYTNVLSQIGGGANFHDHFVCLSQLWQSQWGFGGSAKGCIDGLSFMIGKIHVILSILSLILLPFFWREKKYIYAASTCLVGLTVAVFFMLPISQTIWEKVPQMAFLQYPWRYLLLASFFTSLLGGLVGAFIEKKQKIVGVGFAIFVLCAILVLYVKYFHPQEYVSVTNSALPSTITWTTSKISDEYMPPGFSKPKNSQEVPKSFVVDTPTLTVDHEKIKTQEKYLMLSLAQSQDVFFNLAYFPGWQARDNNVLIPLQPAEKGVKIHLSSGSHAIDVQYAGTLVENLSNMLSVTSVIILILGIIWKGKQYYERKST